MAITSEKFRKTSISYECFGSGCDLQKISPQPLTISYHNKHEKIYLLLATLLSLPHSRFDPCSSLTVCPSTVMAKHRTYLPPPPPPLNKTWLGAVPLLSTGYLAYLITYQQNSISFNWNLVCNPKL